jgi:predicted ATPase
MPFGAVILIMIINSKFISGISIRIPDEQKSIYPYSVPAVKNLGLLKFNKSVTFLIGENGIGKSTIIEAIAVKMGLNAEGGTKNIRFKTRDSHSALSVALDITGFGKPRIAYFLRAESFYNFANYLDNDAESPDNYGPTILSGFGGKSLNSMSHGESFWEIIDSKFEKGGLYILDEPESALSPTRLLALIYKMLELVQGGAQFIISTHSPILLTCPDSEIIEFTDRGPFSTNFNSCSLVNIYKRVLNNPSQFYKSL